MIRPLIAPGMEKWHDRFGKGIASVRPGSLFQGTGHTRQGQIARHSHPTLDEWVHVIDVKQGFLGPLRQPTVFAHVSGTGTDPGYQTGRYVLAHVRLRFADKAARAFIRESMSTNSARASASRRSRAVSFPSRSWRSSSSWRRSCSAGWQPKMPPILGQLQLHLNDLWHGFLRATLQS